jgi:hypothetical protein
MISPKFMLFVALVGAFFLFAPERVLAWLHLADFALRYKPLAGGAFVVGLLFQIPYSIAPWTRKKISAFFGRRAARQLLENLSLDQKRILRQFVEGGRNTLSIPLQNDGEVNLLIGVGILYTSSGWIVKGKRQVSMHRWALRYLRKPPALLERP